MRNVLGLLLHRFPRLLARIHYFQFSREVWEKLIGLELALKIKHSRNVTDLSKYFWRNVSDTYLRRIFHLFWGNFSIKNSGRRIEMIWRIAVFEKNIWDIRYRMTFEDSRSSNSRQKASQNSEQRIFYYRFPLT